MNTVEWLATRIWASWEIRRAWWTASRAWGWIPFSGSSMRNAESGSAAKGISVRAMIRRVPSDRRHAGNWNPPR
ncbi:hypothetical protein D3C83_140390 [compost metagenome]